MPDGGFRSAYNLQMATDVESQVIVAVAVTNRGTDQGEGLPVEEQVAQRTGRHPKAYLMDGGYVDLEQIENLEERGVQVYAPPKEGKGAEEAIRQRRTKPGVEAWRMRMSSEEGQSHLPAPSLHGGVCQRVDQGEAWAEPLQRARYNQGHWCSPAGGHHP